MKSTRMKILATLFLGLITYVSTAQGCSDAGFCTLNNFKPNEINDNAMKNQIKIGTSYGGADHSISIFGSYLEYNRQISEKLEIGSKLTSLSQSGNGISNFGISDLYLTENYRLNKKTKLTLGTKIPFTSSNEFKNNLPLPMDYQSSLGTFDLIVGVGYEVKKIQFVLAIQQPLSQNNNEFLAESYLATSNLREFQSTNNYKRNGDVLLRSSYPITLNNKFKITPSILPIYHLSNDKFTNALGVENEIEGSRGLTINGNAYFDYKINSKNALQLNIGMPFLTRTSRPDGLTRSFIMNLEYKIQF